MNPCIYLLSGQGLDPQVLIGDEAADNKFNELREAGYSIVVPELMDRYHGEWMVFNLEVPRDISFDTLLARDYYFTKNGNVAAIITVFDPSLLSHVAVLADLSEGLLEAQEGPMEPPRAYAWRYYANTGNDA